MRVGLVGRVRRVGLVGKPSPNLSDSTHLAYPPYVTHLTYHGQL